jgi:hypothetical protein
VGGGAADRPAAGARRITAGVFTALVPTAPWSTVAGLVVGGLIVAIGGFNHWRALA